MNNQTTNFGVKITVLLLLVASMMITNSIQPEPKVQVEDLEAAPSIEQQ